MESTEANSLDRLAAIASLEILTGPARGTASWLSEPVLDVSLDEAERIRIAEAGSEPLANGIFARLQRAGDSYEIEARGDNPLWINGERVTSKRLEQRDLIEFGEKGPLSRFRLHHQGDRINRSLGDMLADSIDYTRVSRRPTLVRLQRAAGDFLQDFTLRTTVVFRIGVILALVALAWLSYQQYRSSELLQQQAESRSIQLENFARSLMRTQQESIGRTDLKQLRDELSRDLSDAAARLESLEQRGEAVSRVIAAATPAVVFLQGAWGYRDVETQRMLRYQMDADGNLVYTPFGRPLLTLEGEGEFAVLEFTGTAFLVSAGGTMLTNRHLALPWEQDSSLEFMLEQGLEPELTRLIAYLPGADKAYPVELLKVSGETDLAVLACTEAVSGLPFLELARRTPEPGDEVIVMGYPTGLLSMVLQTGEGFITELESDANLDFWKVAERLAKSKLIRPLSSRGIVGQRSEAVVVYDAETTAGGSGGPVLDIDGRAIAVNTAVIREFGGSNFGIPADYARRLLQDAGIAID